MVDRNKWLPGYVIDCMEKKLIKFYADWCGPCKAMNPIVDRLSAELNIDVEHVNIDEDRVTTEKYGVVSIPTLVLLEDGEEAMRVVGALPYSQLERNITNTSSSVV